jgi:hypothetical protein
MPPRQRRRGLRLARDPRILLLRHPDRPHRDARRRPNTSPTSPTSASRCSPTPSSRASATASSRPTRWSRSTSTATCRATAPRRASSTAFGEPVEDRIYNVKDFDRTLVIDDRTKLVAQKVTQFLKEGGDRYQKTILFCVDQEHAARMRQALINENADLVAENPATSCASPAATPRARRSSATSWTRSPGGRCSSPPRACCPPASTCRPAG